MTTEHGIDYCAREERLNSLTHGLGVAVALPATVLLIVLTSLQAAPWKIVGVSIYGLTFTALFLASTLYHSARQPHLRQAFKVLDHCAIFLLIAGTYTPFLLVNLRGPLGWSLFGLIWGLALAGIVSKLVFGHRYKAIQVGTYLLMGWLIVVASEHLPGAIGATSIALLVAGGVAYTVGVLFYLGHRIPYNHAIWHLYVLAGGGLHWFAVYFGVVQAQI